MQFKLCPDLQPSDVCLVVEQYRDGGYERRFHKHVPRDRLPDAARLDLLRALVARFLCTDWSERGADRAAHI